MRYPALRSWWTIRASRAWAGEYRRVPRGGTRSGTTSPERLWVNPDCGLKTRGRPETLASLENLVSAARTIRAELPQS